VNRMPQNTVSKFICNNGAWLHQQSWRLLVILLLLSVAPCLAQDLPYFATECLPDEPDSVQISWDSPCKSDNWLLDTDTGCRMWDWHPDAVDKVTWTGVCRAGLKDGLGIVQWSEHGESIDRFEGTFRAGVREGLGYYMWNATNWFKGSYAEDRPQGQGTAHIAGVVFSGVWQGGCMREGSQIVAIGVPRRSCTFLNASEATDRHSIK
jgi:hypothetical protein